MTLHPDPNNYGSGLALNSSWVTLRGRRVFRSTEVQALFTSSSNQGVLQRLTFIVHSDERPIYKESAPDIEVGHKKLDSEIPLVGAGAIQSDEPAIIKSLVGSSIP